MQTVFPTLYSKHAAALEEMLSSLWENVDAFAQVGRRGFIAAALAALTRGSSTRHWLRVSFTGPLDPISYYISPLCWLQDELEKLITDYKFASKLLDFELLKDRNAGTSRFVLFVYCWGVAPLFSH